MSASLDLGLVTAGVLLAALFLYAVSGGADYGAGLWDLLATGPRRERQRALIARAIGPIWEANHVWLILIVVLLFVGFPRAFAELSVRMHIPMTLILLGMVLRGSAFVFHHYDPDPGAASARWSAVFAWSSAVTPFMLGTTLGAVAAGRLRGPLDLVSPWLAPLPLLLGAWVVALFALTAAVYLCVEARERDMQDDLRARALLTAGCAGALSWACLLVARREAPHIAGALLSGRPYVLLLAHALGLGLLAALTLRRYRLARLLVIGLVGVTVLGLGLAQHPYLIYPTHRIAEAQAPAAVLRPVLLVLGLGALVLGPALGALYLVFKGGRAPD